MKELPWIKNALLPLSWIYGAVTDVRNFLFDKGILRSEKVLQKVIVVGNLTVGGTGKTPVIEYLARHFAPKAPTAILSRGYGRLTKGFHLADNSSSADTIGDEPFQFYSKFQNEVVVAVCEKRVEGAERILNFYPKNKLLLLDDAFQHRAIQRDVNILLNDYNRPFYEDHPFPAGRLRERRHGARRADAVIVTKCPANLPVSEKEYIMENIRRYTRPGVPVFFATTRYDVPQSYEGGAVELKNVKMVAGIANPQPFAAYLTTRFSVTDQKVFPDHHNYTPSDVEDLIKNLKNDTFVVTTEKDMVKLKPLVVAKGCAARFAYVPVSVDFGDDEQAFAQWVTSQTTDRF
ncbi:tetraacyldisaccharide 4'-kinase [Dyadobacter sp. BE34]|uniref:Tetraacyldisaccharide 4'-kinase n=1 Tax=Dyadobacter fermentans TaxID=94254 RepID=A0ABU1R3E3_9BACT|nr:MULTISPECIES: tetraacyldisaccharide 4'-kinase [Dyadobacter]MDR6807485.1 tetraacyldisaccharide 4'-kinase [Dyadobacter fermentans]MDR7045226.1 tetraacyldisaccharide 4'-kinase [Dyadobacter sp. BE242]MDR7199037.1 tetraacyldisaccharide 4'-kinase [Dyadobacter sp. BE34]MDR7216997.1 tetraacyldisaccharide 4'-kinase [Dyadobacter sp. BE31]MDR7264930.1 tetraacyldisaccharide 4'-kinase [Dyadobacter sp. BE32]